MGVGNIEKISLEPQGMVWKSSVYMAMGITIKQFAGNVIENHWQKIQSV